MRDTLRLIPKVIYRLIISSAYRITVYMILPISAYPAEHCDSLPYSDRRPYFRTLCKSSLPHMGKELPFIFFFSVRQSGRMTLGVVGGGGTFTKQKLQKREGEEKITKWMWSLQRVWQCSLLRGVMPRRHILQILEAGNLPACCIRSGLPTTKVDLYLMATTDSWQIHLN